MFVSKSTTEERRAIDSQRLVYLSLSRHKTQAKIGTTLKKIFSVHIRQPSILRSASHRVCETEIHSALFLFLMACSLVMIFTTGCVAIMVIMGRAMEEKVSRAVKTLTSTCQHFFQATLPPETMVWRQAGVRIVITRFSLTKKRFLTTSHS